MDSVYAFAYALLEWHKKYCGSKHGLCDEMNEAKVEQLIDYLLAANFTGE